MTEPTNFSDLKGLTLVSIDNLDNCTLIFKTTCGRVFRMEHIQDCCESVMIDDLVGDFKDLIGTPILLAEESSSDAGQDVSESGTWTFYKLATIKGYVDIKWLGESNGYYSESVDFFEVQA